MTIDKIRTRYGEPERCADCQWFDKMRLRQGTFPLHSLEVRKPKPEDDPESGDGTSASGPAWVIGRGIASSG